jgi:hypothetical protein
MKDSDIFEIPDNPMKRLDDAGFCFCNKIKLNRATGNSLVQNKNNKGGYLNNKKAHCFASMV